MSLNLCLCHKVILLGSLDAAMRDYTQLEGSQLRYRASNSDFDDLSIELGIAQLEVG